MKLCSDGLGSKDTPLGTCLVNKYAVWPTMDKNDIDPDYWCHKFGSQFEEVFKLLNGYVTLMEKLTI